MNREYAYSIIYSFIISHQLISLGIAVALVILLWRKPKAFFKLTLFILTITLLFYIATVMNESMFDGVDKKNQLINKTQEDIPQ